MPGMDEELAREISQKASQIGMHFLYRAGAGMKPARNGLGLRERAEDALAAMNATDPQAQADAAALEAAEAPGAYVDGHAAGNVAFKTLAAETPEQAEEISWQLASWNIEHYHDVASMLEGPHAVDGLDAASAIRAGNFEAEGRAQSGFYEIYLPDRQAQEFQAPEEFPYQTVIGNPDGYRLLSKLPMPGDPHGAHVDPDDVLMGDFIHYHDVESLKARVALAGACAEARPEVFWGEGEIPARELEAMGYGPDELSGRKFPVEFETVKWDPEARILTDNLDELGIPYSVEVAKAADDGKGLAVLKLDERHLGYVKQVVDGMEQSGVRGMGASRVRNYAQMAAAAEQGVAPAQTLDDRVFRCRLTKEEHHRLTCALQDMGIGYESALVEPDTGMYELFVAESEMRDHAEEINRAAETFARVKPPEFKEQEQRAYEKSDRAQQNRRQMNAKAQSVRDRQRTEQRQRGAKVSRDVKAAKRSAEAQKAERSSLTRRQSIGR